MIELALIYAVQNYFYNSARQYLVSKINAVNGVLTRYAADSGTNLNAEIRSTLESFSDKDKMNLNMYLLNYIFFENQKNIF